MDTVDPFKLTLGAAPISMIARPSLELDDWASKPGAREMNSKSNGSKVTRARLPANFMK
jgi:hypothetical protein